MSAASQLNNREAKRELNMFVDMPNKRLVFQQAPKYLGVCLDRMLNFRQRLDKWQARLQPAHSSVVLLVQPGEPLPKHHGPLRRPWYYLQLNIDSCVSAPCLSRDSACRPLGGKQPPSPRHGKY